MKEQWKVILTIILLIVVVVFSLQNTEVVVIDFFVRKIEIPLVIVILLSVLLGVIVGLLSSVAAIQSYRKDTKKHQTDANRLRNEMSQLQIQKDKEIGKLKEELKAKNSQKENTASAPNYAEVIHENPEVTEEAEEEANEETPDNTDHSEADTEEATGGDDTVEEDSALL